MSDPFWMTDEFRRWFGGSRFVEDDGRPTVLFHGSPEEISTFDAARSVEGRGIHLGTAAQARMRTSRKGSRIHPVVIAAERTARRRDTGSWTRQALAGAARQGIQAIVYLNRYEGIPTARIEALAASGALARLDRIGDAEFRRLVPEARDSAILLDPRLAKSVFNCGSFSPGPHLTDDPSIASSVAYEDADPSLGRDWLEVRPAPRPL